MSPEAVVRAAARYITGQYSGHSPQPYATGGDLPERHPAQPPSPQSVARHEFVCTYCERGQCARCNDRACTCCYGNQD
jgi:hypothetical protein